MRVIRFVTVIAAALMAAACASDSRTAKSTPPTPYVKMTESHPFGVAHFERPDGWTEIFVRVNESSSRDRARQMAFYYAAYLARTRNANSLYVSRDESGMHCYVTEHRGPGIIVLGDPITLVASLAFTALSASTTLTETYEAYPTHILQLYLSNSDEPAHGMTPHSAAETNATLAPVFKRRHGADASADNSKKSDSARPDPDDFTDAEREQWVNNALANVQVCVDMNEGQKQLKKTGGKPGKPESGTAQEPDPGDETDAAEGRDTEESV